MAEEVATIVRLVFPEGIRRGFEFGIPLKKCELPSAFWKETDDHLAGLYIRVRDTNIYKFTRRITKEHALSEGILCY